MCALLLSATVALTPQCDVITDTVDLIEVNHYYDQRGVLVLDQVIFWDWCDQRCAFTVVAWRLLKTSTQLPQRDRKHGGYVVVWFDKTTLRRVRAAGMRETWTPFDPEVQDRAFVPKHQRRGLTPFGVPKSPLVEATAR